MNIPQFSVANSLQQASNAVGINVLKKSMDAGSSQAIQLIQALPQTDPNVGNTFDARA